MLCKAVGVFCALMGFGLCAIGFIRLVVFEAIPLDDFWRAMNYPFPIGWVLLGLGLLGVILARYDD